VSVRPRGAPSQPRRRRVIDPSRSKPRRPPPDSERIEALYLRFASELTRRVAGTLRLPRHAVEDACQLAWLTLVRRPDVLDGPSPKGWLVTVALHAHLAELRGAPIAEAAIDVVGASLDDVLEARAALRLVAHLRPVRRRVLERRIAGLSYAEIAAELDITYTNVNRQLVESRAELRRAA
jgi:RNA polymerase sigma factor (sigma-70 family)